MRHRLAEREQVLLGTAQARVQPEHGLKRGAAAPLCHQVPQLLELLLVVFAQLADARMHAPEHVLVGRQHERALRASLEPVERFEPQRERIALGLERRDHHVGSNAWQQLVATDEQAILGAVQAHVFRRVTLTDQDLPAARADREHVAPAQAAELVLPRRHERILPQRLEHALDAILRHARACIEVLLLGLWHGPGLRAQHAHHQEFTKRHVQRHAEAFGHPARKPGVVVVEVRAHERTDRRPIQPLRDDVLPQRARLIGREARVDDGPAVVTA